MHRLDAFDKSSEFFIVFASTGEPVPYSEIMFADQRDLFFREKDFLAIELLEVVPVIDLHIEIHINASILLNDEQTQHICPLNDCVVRMDHIVLLQ